MKKIKRTDLVIIAVLLAAIIGITLIILSGRSGRSTSAEQIDADNAITAEDYNGKRIGIKTGSSFEEISFDKFPDSEYFYFDNYSDMTTALKSKKIDGFLTDEPVARMMNAEQSDIGYLKEKIMEDDYHFLLQKDTERSNRLKKEFNNVLSELKSSGELDKMKDKWLSTDETAKTFDDSALTGENGTLNIVTLDDNAPFSYFADNKIKGYAIELVTIFARMKKRSETKHYNKAII